MLDPTRHEPLRPAAWDAGDARSAIDEIAADAIAHFDAQRLWPAHPQDDVDDSDPSLYIGAAGAMWGLDYLARSGATARRHDFRPAIPRLLAVVREAFPKIGYGTHGALHFGDMGAALVAMRIDPAPLHAEIVWARAQANTTEPIRELMWGMPGSMLACLFMAGMTGEERWRQLYATQAARLLDDLQETPNGPLWTQDLYGEHLQWLGPVHGWAGNMIALLRGWDWLTGAQRARVADAVPRTLAGLAVRSDLGANWPATTAPEDLPPRLVQHCHGAPGMVTALADVPFASLQLDALLVDGGKLAWAAGPLNKGSNLCHGTGGNGYAFLKLHRRTKDAVWLERARSFAMTAIAQCREKRLEVGRGRYSLWTGDVGLACFLWDCIEANPRFPTVDVL